MTLCDANTRLLESDYAAVLGMYAKIIHNDLNYFYGVIIYQ